MQLSSRMYVIAVISFLEICFAIPFEKRPETASSQFAERAATTYTLPQDSSNPLGRAAAIAITQLGFTYGAAVAGGPYYPSGALGLSKAAADQVAIQLEVVPEGLLSGDDTLRATADAVFDKVQITNRASNLSMPLNY